MKKRIAFALVAVLLVIGYLAQPEYGPPAGDEAPAAAQETELAEDRRIDPRAAPRPRPSPPHPHLG